MILAGMEILVASGLGQAITGLYRVSLPEATTLPAATYQIVGGSSQPTFDTSGMQKVRVQFDFFGVTYLSVATARAALIALLNGYHGVLSDDMFLQNVEYVQSMDFFENTARQFRCAAEFYLYFCFNN